MLYFLYSTGSIDLTITNIILATDNRSILWLNEKVAYSVVQPETGGIFPLKCNGKGQCDEGKTGAMEATYWAKTNEAFLIYCRMLAN